MTKNYYNDPVMFIDHFIKHQSLDNGLIDFKLYSFQEEMVNKFHHNKMNICSSSRQSGKSSTSLYYLLYRAIFNDFSNILIASPKKNISFDLLERLKFAYENIDELKYNGANILPKVIKSNRGYFELDNGSRIITGGISECVIRGQTFTDIFLDEFAFVPYQKSKDFMDILYPIVYSTKSTKIIIISTKNKGSYFNELLDNSKKRINDFVVSEYNWDSVPGRNEEWKQKIISMMGKESFHMEYEI